MSRPVKLTSAKVPKRLNDRVKKLAKRRRLNMPEAYDLLLPLVDSIDEDISAKESTEGAGPA